MNLSNILKLLGEIRSNLEDLNRQNSLFLSKAKWKKKILLLTQTFRSKCNQLMTSITLEMLTVKQDGVIEGKLLPFTDVFLSIT